MATSRARLFIASVMLVAWAAACNPGDEAKRAPEPRVETPDATAPGTPAKKVDVRGKDSRKGKLSTSELPPVVGGPTGVETTTVGTETISASVDAATQPREVTLVPPGELAALQQRLDAEVKANQERKCPRPLLRGEPIPGRADEDFIAIIEGDTFKPCYDHLEGIAEPLAAYLTKPVKETPPELTRGHELCFPLLEAIEKAISHSNACSPYLAGRRGLPSMIPLIRAGKAVAVLILQALFRGHTEDALNFGLNWLRFSQDMVRGRGAPLIGAMISVAATKYTIEAMRFALNHQSDMAPEMLERVAKELGALLDTEPGFGSFLPYENYGLSMHMLLPYMRGPDWVPPGGFDQDRIDPTKVLGADKELEGVSREQQMALLWVAVDGNGRRMEEACPEGSRAAQCHAGLVTSAEKMAKEAGENRFMRALKVLASDQPDKEIRAWILDIVSSIATPAFNKYVIRFAHRAFRISALRVHARLRARGAGKTGVGNRLSGPEWQPLLADPATGGLLRFQAVEPGKVTLQPAVAFEGVGADEYNELAYEIVLASERPVQ